MKRIKQVIVIRKDLKMRRGKEVAQGSHASMAFITRQLQLKKGVKLTDVQQEWIDSSFAKVTVRVNSEEELDSIFSKAEDAGLEVHMITDSGRTEFGGVPTKTCLAIGPDYDDLIDAITGELQLY